MSGAAVPHVSVVTPFYNTESYLRECIESVLRQTYDDLEYVLVDNQSSDGSRAIAEEYARRDPRIRLLTTPRFLTQIQNYNFALRQISPGSKYCKMVQADDWLYPQCLAEMVALADAHPSVAVVSSFELRGTNVCGSGLPPEQRVMSGRQACRTHMLQGISLFGTPTTVMIDAAVVRGRDPFYEEERYFEDTEAVYEILHDRDFGFVHQVLSFNRFRPDSLWGRFRPLDPLPLANLTMVARYGRVYLSNEEYRKHLADCRSAYFKMVARAWARRAGDDFMNFHRKGLSDIGEELSRLKLAPYVVAAVKDEIVPRRLLARLGRLFSQSLL